MTIKDVASQAGVSPMTVSRVINGSHRVSPETQRRVEEAIEQLGYIPSRLARGLSARKTGTLAVIVPDVANPFFTLIVREAADAHTVAAGTAHNEHPAGPPKEALGKRADA